MQAGITFAKVWFDDDMVELEVSTGDGSSAFVTTVYVGHDRLAKLARSLESFKSHVYGGIHDIRLGEFGPEYAKGAFHARLHFFQTGRGHVSSPCMPRESGTPSPSRESQAAPLSISSPSRRCLTRSSHRSGHRLWRRRSCLPSSDQRLSRRSSGLPYGRRPCRHAEFTRGSGRDGVYLGWP
jgi:hypothetical protein